LKEDPEIWGFEEVVPAVLYGEYAPPGVDEENEDEDDF
jgi:hypothetical protein